MNAFQWFRFFRLNGNGFGASLRKAMMIRRAKKVRVYPIKRRRLSKIRQEGKP